MDALPISDARSREFTELAQLGNAKLELVRHKLSSCRQKFLKLEQLSGFLADFLDESDALRIASTAISLRRIADRVEVSVDEVFDALTNGLLERGWGKDEIARWNEVSETLRKIVTDPHIELVIKTSDLYYKHQYHLHEMRVVTDIRPVLDENRTSIEAAIIKNTFVIEYSDGNEEDKHLQINLSYEDMKRIRNEFDRALSKTELIQGATEKNMNVPAIIFSSGW